MFELHEFYREFGGKKVDRDEIALDHFRNWISWTTVDQCQ